MKQLSFALLIALCFQSASAQYCGFSGPSMCAPSGTPTIPGFNPSSENLPPLINGEPSSTVLQFKNFDTITFGGQPLRRTASIDTNRFELQRNTLAPSVYFYRIITHTGKSAHGRLVME